MIQLYYVCLNRLYYFRVNGADNGVASLFSGFFMEMMAVLMGASSFLCWKVIQPACT